MKEKIEIQLSKTKILSLLTGAIAFVTFGILFILNPEEFQSPILRNPTAIRMAGIASVVFFGLCLIFIARKLFDNNIGLTIDQYGITDNSNTTSVGLIEWADITAVGTVTVASTKILIIKTNNPDKYIERAKNGISRRAMKANYKFYGSPISITSSSLKIKYNNLERLISEEVEKRK